jgi:hypothetical protein
VAEDKRAQDKEMETLAANMVAVDLGHRLPVLELLPEAMAPAAS